MTGLSVTTLELMLLGSVLVMSILSYLNRRTKKAAYNVAFILVALVQTQIMIARDRAKGVK